MLSVSVFFGLPFVGFKARVPFTTAFATLDEIGFHAGWRGHEIAWTRGSGWTRG